MKLLRTVKGKTHTWKSELTGKKLVVDFGPEHGERTISTRTFGKPAKAAAAQAEALAAARKKGFRLVGEFDPPSVPVPRNPALEAAIREARGTPGARDAFLVYADWLQEQGGPLGEAIALATPPAAKAAKAHVVVPVAPDEVRRGRRKAKMAVKPTAGEAKALAIAAKVGAPPPSVATVGYRNGLWEWLRVENDADWMDNSFDATAVATPIFASPLCAVLAELRIGVVRWDYNADDVPVVLALAGTFPWAKDLERLHLGDVSSDIDMDHHTIGDVGKVISKQFPRLARLKLHSGSQTWNGPNNFEIGGLALPHLRELVIETCALTAKRAKQLCGAKLPALEHLELWFGDPERDADAKAADVAPIVDGKAFPNLVHLGLANSTLTGELLARLVRSPLAKRLASLDLRKGTLDDGETAALVAAGQAGFPALTSIDVGETYVTSAGVRALKKAFPKAKIACADPKEFYDWAPDERFISVHE